MTDILELLGTIPYGERASGGETTRMLREAIKEKAVKRQQASLRFQSEAAAKNRAYSMPADLADLAQGQAPQQMQQAAPPQPQPPPPGSPPQAGPPQPAPSAPAQGVPNGGR